MNSKHLDEENGNIQQISILRVCAVKRPRFHKKICWQKALNLAWKNQLMDVEHEKGKFTKGKMIHAALWFSF